MSGYTPVFGDIYMGTLYGKWPAAPVWASLLPLMDKNGVIDMSLQAIAGMTGWPLDLLQEGIEQLSQPDPGSRTGDAEGRRLVPLDSERPWGWRAVNHGKYKEKARLMAKNIREVESGREAERKRHSRESAGVRRSPPVSDPSNADTNSNTDTVDGGARRPRPRKTCPEDFEVTEDLRTWAAEKFPDVNIDAETEAFRDHEFAVAHSDWKKTWRNWIRKGAKFNGTAQRGAAPRKTKFEQYFGDEDET